jgi:hypothetical protein
MKGTGSLIQPFCFEWNKMLTNDTGSSTLVWSKPVLFDELPNMTSLTENTLIKSL